MVTTKADRQKQHLDPLLKNQLIGGVCAGAVVVFACVRIFVLHASVDGALMNLMSIANAVLSLVVLTSAVRIMLMVNKRQSFDTVLVNKLRDIDNRYGALIEATDAYVGDGANGAVYSIASNTDTVFTANQADWETLEYQEKFSISSNFKESRQIRYFVNHSNMKARSLLRGEQLETTARLLARDTAIAIQRAFSDILTAHALEIHREDSRAVVTITVKSVTSAQDAVRIAELIDYMLFLHFIAT
jgi:hypothetical protein